MFKEKLMALFIITSFLVSFIVPNAYAETTFQPEKFPYTEMQIQVMPEFDYPENWPKDTPSLLIGQYGTFTNKSGQDFDGKIEIAVPANEKGFQAYLVAEFPEDNKPEVQRPFDVDKDKGTMSWKPSKPIKNGDSYRFVVEYYTSSVEVKDNRSFTFEYRNPAEIGTLDVIFYAPMEAKKITLEPKAPNNTKSEYGEELFYYQYKDVKAGESYTYSFAYQKDGFKSTLEAINEKQPPNDENHAGVNGTATDQITGGSNSSGGSGGSEGNRPLIGIGGASVIGIAIIIAGVFVYLGLKGRSQSAPKASSSKTVNSHPKKQHVKKENKSISVDEKKELRKKLLTGKIDQETYDEEMKKLI
ncbi:hypothetical protein [Neobacillus sp. DY30]|uniref:hypothetical protein n=1 Tax=Neobacillus sp. DY30 TaxID=3047871 RepID=UPI0024BFFA34|nr:hypothetical protein [Neobacillus sp. DY30]WHX99266.1 hypothetical protein QNH29_22125 [Neobacillus sp. DY30]